MKSSFCTVTLVITGLMMSAGDVSAGLDVSSSRVPVVTPFVAPRLKETVPSDPKLQCFDSTATCIPDGNYSIEYTVSGPGCEWTMVIDWGDKIKEKKIYYYPGITVPHRYNTWGVYSGDASGGGEPTDPNVSSCTFIPSTWKVEVPSRFSPKAKAEMLKIADEASRNALYLGGVAVACAAAAAVTEGVSLACTVVTGVPSLLLMSLKYGRAIG